MKKTQAQLLLAPEQNQLVKDILTMTRDQMADKYGLLGDNIQFDIKIDSKRYACLEVVPHADRTPTVEVTLTEKGQTKIPKLKKDGLYDIAGSYDFVNHKSDEKIEINVQEEESLRRTGNQFIFQAIGDKDSTNERYHAHDGEFCTILRALTPKEADILTVGLMWEAEFPNGEVMHIFDEELKEPIRLKQLTKPPLTDTIENAKTKTTTVPLKHQDKAPEL